MLRTILILTALTASTNDGPWVIHLDDGTRMVAYCDESDFEKDIFTVVEDKPWAEPVAPRTLFKKDVKGRYPVGSAELAAYYARGWQANGGIQIDTPHGKMWVFEEEYKLAQRAAQMAQANEPPAETPPPAPASAAPAAPNDAGPAFGQLWGAHIAVLTLGLGLSGLVVWFLIIE